MKVIGVIGGMGPEATADFFMKLIRRASARSDAEQPRVVIDSNPHIPDRTAFVLGEGPSPVDELVRTARNVVRAGAGFLTLPCITAHGFIDEIRDAVDVPVISAVALTASEVDERFETEDVISILSTAGTLKMKLFQAAMPGRAFMVPTDEEQEGIVTPAIYGPHGVKAVGVDIDTLDGIIAYAAELARRGAGAIIAGCTEFSVLLSGVELPIPLIDPMCLLAEEAIRTAKD